MQKIISGYIIEDAAGNELYHGKMLKNSIVGARIFEFIDHRTGYSQQHEVGHISTSTTKSSFKLDGEKVWDVLHK